jgi:hypothetical protein
MEGFNPNPGLSLGETDRATSNDVLDGSPLVSARFVTNAFPLGVTVALAAPQSDTRAIATVISGGTDPRDPNAVVNAGVNDPDGANADDQIALAFDLGDLAAGASTSMRYFVFFGTTPGQIFGADSAALYNQVNNGTGTGHLTATTTSAASETLTDGSSLPQLPYRVYYPEGNSNSGIYEFLPISNPNSQATRVYVVARYEFGQRDQILGVLDVPANSRSGLTITTPDLIDSDGQLVNRVGVPYALELRSDRPIAATSSHYDVNLLAENSAVGESFTSVTDTTWTFGTVAKSDDVNDFIVWYNPTTEAGKVTLTFYPSAGGPSYYIAFDLNAFRRGGISVGGNQNFRIVGGDPNQTFSLPNGNWGVETVSEIPIVAALSHYDRTATVAEGNLGEAGGGSTTGVIPEGQFGLNATEEIIGVLNSSNTAATVIFSFLLDNGSAYRTSLNVPARAQRELDVSELPNFPTGRPYSIFYESNTEVSVNSRSNAFGQQLASSTASRAYSWWGFGEGFRPGDNDPGHPGVVEHLRLYNPSDEAVTIEISITYSNNPVAESFRRTIQPRRVAEFDLDQFITGSRRATRQFFSTTVKAATPIVAYMTHVDRAFPGGFGTLGTPLGIFVPVA